MLNDVISDDTLSQQHKAIRAHIQQIFKMFEDIEGMKLIDSGSITPENLNTPNTLWYHMRKTFTYLEGGLQVHWDLGQRVLHSLIGDCIANSICADHAAILRKINELHEIFLKNKPPDWIILRDHLKDNFTQLNRMMLRHRKKEDAIFDLHKKGQ